MEENKVLVLKGDSTTLSTGRKRWPREKFRKLFMWWYWYMYYDGSQYKDIIYIYIYEVFDDKYWWVISYEIVVRIIYLKGLFPQPNVSKFHLLSYLTLTPFISHYRYIKGIIGVEILGRQQLRTILWNWGFYYYSYDIKQFIG